MTNQIEQPNQPTKFIWLFQQNHF